jgi:TP901 family phage tail tape measure protein
MEEETMPSPIVFSAVLQDEMTPILERIAGTLESILTVCIELSDKMTTLFNEMDIAAERTVGAIETVVAGEEEIVLAVDNATAAVQKNTAAQAENTAATTAGNSKKSASFSMMHGLMWMGLLTLGTALVSTAKDAADFDTEMTTVFATAYTGTKSFEQLSQSAIDLGLKFGIDPLKVAEGMYQVYSAISDVTKAEDTLNVAIKGSIATGIEQAAWTKIITSAVNAFSGSSLTAMQASDALISMIAHADVPAETIVSSFGRMITGANEGSIAIQQMGAAFATVTSQGATARQAETTLGQMMNTTMNNTDMFRKNIEQLGLSFDDTAWKNHDFVEVLKYLNDTAKAAGTTIDKLYDESSYGGMAFLLMKDGGEEFRNKLDQINKDMGITDKAFKDRTDSIAYNWGKMTGAMQAGWNTFIEYIKPSIVGSLQDITANVITLIKKIEDHGPQIVSILEKLKPVFGLTAAIFASASLIRFIESIGQATISIGKFLDVFGLVGAAGVFASFSEFWPVLVVIAAVVALLIVLFISFGDQIGAFGNTVKEKLLPYWDKFLELMQRFGSEIANKWNEQWPKIQPALERFGESLKKLEPLLENIAMVLGIVLVIALEATSLALQGFIMLLPYLLDFLTPIVSAIGDFAKIFNDLAKFNFSKLGEDIKNFGTDLYNIFNVKFGADWGKSLRTFLDDQFSKLDVGKAASDLGKWYLDVLQQAWNKVLAAPKDTSDAINDAAQKTMLRFVDILSHIDTARIIGAWMQASAILWKATRDILNHIIDQADNLITVRIPLALKNFFTSAYPQMLQMLQKVHVDVAYWVGYIIGTIIRLGIDIPKAFDKWTRDSAKSISDWFGNLWASFVSWETGISNQFGDWITQMGNNLKEFVRTFPQKFQEAINAFLQTVEQNLPRTQEEFWKLVQTIMRAIGMLPLLLAELAIEAIGALVVGIWQGMGSLWNAGWQVAQSFLQGIKDGLDKKSPSRVLLNLGGSLNDDLALGIMSTADRVMNTAVKASRMIAGAYASGSSSGISLSGSGAGFLSANRSGSGSVSVTVNATGGLGVGLQMLSPTDRRQFALQIGTELGYAMGLQTNFSAGYAAR